MRRANLVAGGRTPSDELDPGGVARRQSSPYTGKLSARPAGKPGCLLVEESLRRSLLRHSVAAVSKNDTGRPVCVLGGMAESIWSDVVRLQPTLGRDRTASRRSAPGPGRRTRREDHAPSHRPQMSSGRLFLDRGARQHCPSPLHRHGQTTTPPHPARLKPDISTLQRIGHFYFALTREEHGRMAGIPRIVVEESDCKCG